MTARRQGAPGGVERRSAPRRAPDELVEPVLVVGSQLVNIGPGGLMLEAPIPLPADSPIHLHLLVGGERADVDARVRGCVQHARGRGRAWAVRVQFEVIDPRTRARLDRALGPRPKGRS